MDIIQFENGTKTSNAYVEIDGEKHYVVPAQYSGNTPMSAYNLNRMQNNIKTNITIQRESVTISTEIQANTDYTIPLNYKVR